ncbi:Pho80p cyclin [Tieghemiomyces parasiticus]|uniref:Pho80p cyclin n=1 Tax=Tieghemiomyces parasiticus TaxID=78921 RepID=A0A9W8ABZ2_9FUNG|nr:Pho80p cyclin [Tieghemiomyces parasiticus]
MLPNHQPARATASTTLGPAASDTNSTPASLTTTLPNLYHEVDSAHLTHLVAAMLDQLIAVNDNIPFGKDHLTRFHSRVSPGISVYDYLVRIVRYTTLENTCLLLLLVYIDRASAAKVRTHAASSSSPPAFHISSLTVHRFLITAVTIAAKAVCDFYHTNSHYARVGGISVQEINSLEIELLIIMGWDVSTRYEMLQKYYVSLVVRHPSYCLPDPALALAAVVPVSPSTPTPLVTSSPAATTTASALTAPPGVATRSPAATVSMAQQSALSGRDPNHLQRHDSATVTRPAVESLEAPQCGALRRQISASPRHSPHRRISASPRRPAAVGSTRISHGSPVETNRTVLTDG